MENKFQEKVLKDIAEERNRQDAKWGVDQVRDTFDWMLKVTTEEYGEIANADLEKDYENRRTEAIQTAACLVKMVEILDEVQDLMRQEDMRDMISYEDYLTKRPLPGILNGESD